MIPSLSPQGLGLPVTDPLGAAEIAAAVGFPGVHLHLHHIAAPHRAALARLITVNGLAVTWIYPPDALFRPDQQARAHAIERFITTTAFAARLGVRVISSGLPTHHQHTPTLRRTTMALEPLVRLAAQADIAFGVQPSSGAPPYAGNGPPPDSGLAILLPVLDRLGPTTGIVADSTHLTATGTHTNLRSWVGRVVDVHLTDPPTGRLPPHRSAPGHDHTGVGTHQPLLVCLAAAGYQGPVRIDGSVPPDHDVPTAAARTLAYLRSLLDDRPATIPHSA
jgi:sugar phosphate isomerase/epimerase